MASEWSRQLLLPLSRAHSLKRAHEGLLSPSQGKGGGPCGAGMGGAQIMEPRKEREGKRERGGEGRRIGGRKATSRRKRVFIATLDS